MQVLEAQSHSRRCGPTLTSTGKGVAVRMLPDLLSALDVLVAWDRDDRSRPQALRPILSDWLTGHGYLAHRDNPEGAN